MLLYYLLEILRQTDPEAGNMAGEQGVTELMNQCYTVLSGTGRVGAVVSVRSQSRGGSASVTK